MIEESVFGASVYDQAILLVLFCSLEVLQQASACKKIRLETIFLMRTSNYCCWTCWLEDLKGYATKPFIVLHWIILLVAVTWADVSCSRTLSWWGYSHWFWVSWLSLAKKLIQILWKSWKHLHSVFQCQNKDWMVMRSSNKFHFV